jgi:hypothetical protein
MGRQTLLNKWIFKCEDCGKIVAEGNGEWREEMPENHSSNCEYWSENESCWGCGRDWLEVPGVTGRDAGLTEIEYEGKKIKVCVTCYEDIMQEEN